MKNKNFLYIFKNLIILFPFLIFTATISFKWDGKFIYMSLQEISWRYKQIGLVLLIGGILLLFYKKYGWRAKFLWFIVSANLMGVFFIPYSNGLSTRYVDMLWFLTPNDFLPRLKYILIFPTDKFFLTLFVIEIFAVIMVFLLIQDSFDIIFEFTFALFFLYCCLAVPIEFLAGCYKTEGLRVIYLLKAFFLIYPIFSGLMFYLLINQKKKINKVIMVILHILGSFAIIFYVNIYTFEDIVNCFLYFGERYILLSNTLYLYVISWFLLAFRSIANSFRKKYLAVHH